ncbi:DUF5820 family protein [Halocalculus aciditolerans]|uniref:Uncharacterized protein n=1 Tax=Halocalculus aciditolerans TaxID=1383812 RepID=A0A830FJR4_9EURY|nr:DUF5820 family protein [Halocalculus aciditolerans]GGL53583.1 hypothetical protein GCM10009039_09730 [Halocalculus aciditolerans]
MSDGDAWDALPESWVVWSDADDGRAVLVFRPDVFDGDAYPAACLPTVYVSQRPPERRMRGPGAESDRWFVSLTLEPEVRVREVEADFDSRDAAVDAAIALASAFAAGDVDYRSAYQVPREDYFDALDDLTD